MSCRRALVRGYRPRGTNAGTTSTEWNRRTMQEQHAKLKAQVKRARARIEHLKAELLAARKRVKELEQRLREHPPPADHRYLTTELGTRREPPNKDGSL